MPRPLTPRPLARRARHAARAGMTIVELMVTSAIVLVVVGSLATIMVGQARQLNRTQGATNAQRDLRMGAALLPMDLRAVSRTDGDLVALEPTRIELFATIGHAIVCDTVPGRRVFVTPPTGTARATLTAWYAEPSVGDTLKVLTRSSTGAQGDEWITAGLLDEPSDLLAIDPRCAGEPYTDPVRDPRATKPRLRWIVDTLRRQVRPGSPVRVLRRVRYELYQGTASPTDWYLGYSEFRNRAWTPLEAIAGPFTAANGTSGGLAFRYFDLNGAPLATPAPPTQVGRIDMTLRARQAIRGGRDSVVVRDSIALRVALRNRN